MTNYTNLSSLKILLCNSYGIKQHEPELLNSLIENKIDIALISETHYTSNSKYFFPGYKY
jgi:predicted solute-binding protein